MLAGGLLAVADGHRRRPSRRHRVAAGEHAGAARSSSSGPTCTTPSSTVDAGDALEEREIGVLAEGQDQRVGTQLLELARSARDCRRRPASSSRARACRRSKPVDGREPPDGDALVERLVELVAVGGHALAVRR